MEWIIRPERGSTQAPMAVVSSLAGPARQLDSAFYEAVVEHWVLQHRNRKVSRDFGYARRRRRMVWEDRVASLSPAEFKRTYRMSLEVFNRVLEAIRDSISVKAPRKARSDTHGAVPRRFLFASATEPGCTHDSRAFKASSLYKVILTVCTYKSFTL